MPNISECFEILKQEYSFANMFNIICLHKDKVAAEYLEDGEIKQITYNQYQKMIYACAQNISNISLQPENKFIGLKSENSPLWSVAFWGIMLSGYVPVLIDVKFDAITTLHVLRQAGANAIITDKHLELNGTTQIKIEDIAGLDKQKDSFETNFADSMCLCTSGTTTTSRVFLYDGNAITNQVLNAQRALINCKDMISDKNDFKALAFLPFHHVLGFLAVCLLYSLFGKTIVYIADRSPDTILNACKTHKVTNIISVPLLWNNVAQGIMRKAKLSGQEEKLNKIIDLSISLQRKFGRAGRAFVSRVFFKNIKDALVGQSGRMFLTGGGHTPPETLRIINGIGYRLGVGYGMTETGLNSCEFRDDIDKVLSGGTDIFDNIEMFIDNSTEPPELKVKGNSLHCGQMVDGIFIPRDPNSYFSTGDIAVFKNDSYYIEGRVKEVIINASGENIYPDELEDSVITLKHVNALCALGVSNTTLYEDICLVIDMGEKLSDNKAVDELINEICGINATLPMYKKFNRVMLAKNSLPLANGIKVRRQFVKKQIEEGTFEFIEIDLKNKCLLKNTIVEDSGEREFDTGEFNEIKEVVRKIFAEVLSLRAEMIKDNDHFIDDLGGDSLSAVSVFTKAEEVYNLIIPDTEYFSATSVYEFAKLLYGKIYGLDAGIEEETGAARKITSFTESREWLEFAKRKETLGITGTKDPYFIPHDSALKDTSLVDGKDIINLGSYNYLGFSGSDSATDAAMEALKKYGASSSGSRLLAGEKPVHRKLESAIAKWKHTQDAIVLVGGHSTNVTFVGNFCNKNDLILYDALSHNSITQGAELSKSDSKAFPHNDLKTLEYILKSTRDKYEKILIVVEGVYSMDGDIAPIPEFVRLKKQYGAFLMVDEAHSSCVIGENGGGADDYFDLDPDDIDIKMGTLSKGLGTCGGYLCGSYELIEYLKYGLPGFVFSVGISPALAAATLSAVNTMIEGNPEVEKLHENIKVFVEEAKRFGFNTCLAGETAIVPIMVGRDEDAFLVSERMMENGVFVPPAVFPAVPNGQARLRFSLTSLHKKEQLLFALEKLNEIFENLGLNK